MKFPKCCSTAAKLAYFSLSNLLRKKQQRKEEQLLATYSLNDPDLPYKFALRIQLKPWQMSALCI